MKKQYLLLSAFVLLVQFAQAQFTFTGEFRPRAEMRNGFNSLIPEDTDAAFSISTRARLNAGYKSDAYEVYLSLQDVITWGENGQINTVDANNSLAFFEAWAKLKLAPGFSTKLGRQVLSYDDQRILGGLGWDQRGRVHDGAMFSYKTDTKLKIDFMLAFNQNNTTLNGYRHTGTPYTHSSLFSYKAMQMLHFNKKWSKVGLSILALNNTFQNLTTTTTTTFADGSTTDVIDESTVTSSAGTTSDLQTFGTHLTYKDKGFGVAFNGYYQTGQRQGTLGNSGAEIKGAYLLGLDLTYKATDKLTLGLGGEIISGDKDSTDGESNTFFPLYGTNHKFNGWMDYFYVGNHGAPTAPGLIDIHAMAKIKTGKKSGLMIKALNFMTEQELGTGETQLGTEVDLVFTQKFKGYALKLGYSQMFASQGMEDLKGIATPKNVQNWAWAMLIIKPKFFTGAKKAPKKM